MIRIAKPYIKRKKFKKRNPSTKKKDEAEAKAKREAEEAEAKVKREAEEAEAKVKREAEEAEAKAKEEMEEAERVRMRNERVDAANRRRKELLWRLLLHYGHPSECTKDGHFNSSAEGFLDMTEEDMAQASVLEGTINSNDQKHKFFTHTKGYIMYMDKWWCVVRHSVAGFVMVLGRRAPESVPPSGDAIHGTFI